MQKEHETNFDDKKFVSLKEAAKISRYAKDYIGQLCRGKKIEAKRLGRDWFVNLENLISYKQEMHGEQSTICSSPTPIPIEDKIQLVSVRNFDIATKKFEDVTLATGKKQCLEKLFDKKDTATHHIILPKKDAWDSTLFANFQDNAPSREKSFATKAEFYNLEKEVTPTKTNIDFNFLRALFKPAFLTAIPLVILTFIIIKDPAQVAANIGKWGSDIQRAANYYADNIGIASNQAFNKLSDAGEPIIQAIHNTDPAETIFGGLNNIKYAGERTVKGFLYQYSATFDSISNEGSMLAAANRFRESINGLKITIQLPNVRLSSLNLSDTSKILGTFSISWPHINISLPEFTGKQNLVAFAETVSDFVDAVHNRSGEVLVFAKDGVIAAKDKTAQSAANYLRKFFTQTSKFAVIIKEKFSGITQKPATPPPTGETPAITPITTQGGIPFAPIQLTSEELTQLKNIVVADLTGKGLIVERTVEKPTTIERTLERIISGVSPQDLDEKLSILNNKILSQIVDLKNQLASRTQENFQAIALTNKIDQLTGTKLYNVTVLGMSGLADSDIPNGITASNYLPLSGGTLTGALTGTNLTLSGDLNVAGTQTFSGALSVPYFSATSATHASFINYSLAVGTSTPYAKLSI